MPQIRSNKGSFWKSAYCQLRFVGEITLLTKKHNIFILERLSGVI